MEAGAYIVYSKQHIFYSLRIGIGYWHCYKPRWTNIVDNSDITSLVTHWMPLPEPPPQQEPEDDAKADPLDALHMEMYKGFGKLDEEIRKVNQRLGALGNRTEELGKVYLKRLKFVENCHYELTKYVDDLLNIPNKRIDDLENKITSAQDKLAAINNIIHSTSPFASHSDLKRLEEKVKDDHDNVVILEEHIRDLKSTLLKGIEILISKSL